jgi:hypothetical protein
MEIDLEETDTTTTTTTDDDVVASIAIESPSLLHSLTPKMNTFLRLFVVSIGFLTDAYDLFVIGTKQKLKHIKLCEEGEITRPISYSRVSIVSFSSPNRRLLTQFDSFWLN